MKKINILLVVALLLSFSVVSAQTKPAPGTDINSLSYVFYLYYSNGELFGDRDYTVKYDVVNEVFVPESVGSTFFKGEIINNKSEIVKTFSFDPQKGDLNFKNGKVTVKGPYAPDGFRANFFNSSGNPILAIFVTDSSICDGDGFCNASLGEDDKTCPADCKVARTSPFPSDTPLPIVEEGFNFYGFDLIQLGTYAVGGLGVGVIAWIVWKQLKKRREGDFPLPPSSPMSPPLPPSQPLQ